MDNLLQDKSVITSPPTRQKTALEGTYNTIKEGPNPVDQNLRDNFINSVTQASREKFLQRLGTIHLRNKGN